MDTLSFIFGVYITGACMFAFRHLGEIETWLDVLMYLLLSFLWPVVFLLEPSAFFNATELDYEEEIY